LRQDDEYFVTAKLTLCRAVPVAIRIIAARRRLDRSAPACTNGPD